MIRDDSFGARISGLDISGADVLAINDVEAVRAGREDVLIRCPAHDDDRPSFSVHLATGRGHCFGCGTRVGDAVALHRALGGFASMSDALLDLEGRRGTAAPPLLVRPASTTNGKGRGQPAGDPVEVRRWTYRRADGTAAFDVVRLQYRLDDGSWFVDPAKGKAHKQYRPAAHGSSRWGMPAGFDAPGSRPLYALADLHAAPADVDLFVVEGEPAADALRGQGAVATTSSGGAAAPERTDWSPLAGRRVVIWPDHDEAGRRYAARVAELLRALEPPPTVSWIDVTALDLPAGGDAADWVARRQEGLP